MLYSLIAAAFGQSPTHTALVEVTDEGDRRKVDVAGHVGLDLTGTDPGIAGRVDFGHRLSVEGIVMGVAPRADALKWTGGASIGIHVAPVRLQLGAQGSLDLRLGAGLKATGRTLASVSCPSCEPRAGAVEPGWDLGSWASSTLHLSPDGTWSIYGGVVATDLQDEPGVVPEAGVRFKLP